MRTKNLPEKLLQWCLLLVSLLSTLLSNAATDDTQSLLSQLRLPAGFSIEQFSDVSAYGKPRMMVSDQQGQLLVTLTDTGRVVRINKNHTIDILAENLDNPNGIAMLGEDILVAEQGQISRLVKRPASSQTEQWVVNPFIRHLPSGGHGLKTVKVSPDGFIYINIGSSCNVCIEEDPLRGTLLRYDNQGHPAGAIITVGRHAQSAIWARGLRNTQGFTWQPETFALFATNDGADNRSSSRNGVPDDNLPPEQLNKIEAGQHYGWPFCWADPNQSHRMYRDPNLDSDASVCDTAQTATITLPPHSTPIGITFLDQSQFPPEWQNDAVIALHGSWNRKQPTGYALIRVQFRNQQPVATVSFIEGWLQGDTAWGRPVDVIVGHDGCLYLSDDKTGWIYRVRFQS